MIVLIEDSKTEQVKFINWIKSAGNPEVIVFETMREANGFIKKRRAEIRLIVCDVHLPDADVKNARLLKATFPDIPTLLISAAPTLPATYWRKTEGKESFIKELHHLNLGAE